MKTHQLILLTTVLFITLFYDEEMGLNLGILGISYALLTFLTTAEEQRTRNFLLIFAMAILSSAAFAWYSDFASFLAVFTSLFLLAFKSRSRDLKSLLIIPVFAVNFITFIFRLFTLDEWLPKTNSSAAFKKLLSVVFIPAFFLLLFFGVYSLGSTHFADVFRNWELDLNVWEFAILSAIGFFIAFNFWNFKIEEFIFKWNHYLKNDFCREDKNAKPVTSFFDAETMRKSGVVTLLSLNILLAVFIFTFNYEQFIEISKSGAQLSVETHDRVTAVIFSIGMAVLVIMFFLKGNLNFDPIANTLKLLAVGWIFLNVLLVFSAGAKNTEYIVNLGLTYKRLGVFAFLILALVGLFLTLIKIRRQKTNAFILNHLVWYFYGTVLVCSYFNWGGFITTVNAKNRNFDLGYHLNSVHYNEKALLEIAGKTNDPRLREELLKSITEEQRKSFLSQILYYKTLP